jgi:hypothetical protein
VRQQDAIADSQNEWVGQRACESWRFDNEPAESLGSKAGKWILPERRTRQMLRELILDARDVIRADILLLWHKAACWKDAFRVILG